MFIIHSEEKGYYKFQTVDAGVRIIKGTSLADLRSGGREDKIATDKEAASLLSDLLELYDGKIISF